MTTTEETDVTGASEAGGSDAGIADDAVGGEAADDAIDGEAADDQIGESGADDAASGRAVDGAAGERVTDDPVGGGDADDDVVDAETDDAADAETVDAADEEAGAADEEAGAADEEAGAAGRVRTLVRPGVEAAREHVAAAIERGDLATLVGRCTVEYEGRAASTLGPGDRHVVLKPDGTAMVHTDEGRKPVNWQPPGCAHAVAVEDGTLRVVSTRETPDERLVVEFESLLQVAAFALTDEADLALTGTHEDLRERVLDEPELVEPGFAPLATERATPAGAVDVYGEDADGRPVVLELKRGRTGPDAVGQLERYVEALRRDLHDDAEVRGVLVAPSTTDRARQLLAERGLEFVALEPTE